MDELFNLIANVGFPIAVAGYLLIRIESKIDSMTVAITQLTSAVDAFKVEVKKVN